MSQSDGSYSLRMFFFISRTNDRQTAELLALKKKSRWRWIDNAGNGQNEKSLIKDS